MKLFSCMLQILASMAVCYTFYHLFLRKLTFFSLNRIYLLSTLLLSVSIPFIQIELKGETVGVLRPVAENVLVQSGDNLGEEFEGLGNAFISTVKATPKNFYSNWQAMLLYGYLIISLYMLIRFIAVIVLLLSKICTVSKQNGVRTITSFWKFSNCSFFNLIIIDSDNISGIELQQVILHEREHVRKFHSIDKTVIELLRIVMWFNPFLYLYRSAINQVQEFEVDHVMSKQVNKCDYSNLLLKLTMVPNQFLVNTFGRNPLKTRIQMLFTKQSDKMKKVAYLFILPLVAGMLWVFSVDIVYAASPERTKKKDSRLHKEQTVAESTFRERAVKEIQNKLIQIEKANTAIDDEIKRAGALPLLRLNRNIDDPVANTGRVPEALRADKFRVVLDPGHGGKDKSTKAGDIYEKDLTLDISRVIKKVLEDKGYEVVLTRDADVTVPLAERAAAKGDVFVSIHVNTSMQVNYDPKTIDVPNGIEIFTSKYYQADSVLSSSRDKLAGMFQKELSELNGIKFNKIRDNMALAILKNNTAPAILLELGFMTNKSDLTFLTSKSNQQQIAFAFVGAIEAYKKNK